MFNEPKRKSMWILLIGGGLSTLGIFISVPLISLHAFKVFGLSPYHIGLLSGIWPATVFIFSIFSGMAADRWGYLWAIRTSAAINILAFLIMAECKSVHFFAVGLVVFGIGKSFFDSSIRAAMGRLSTEESREKYFRIRYTLQNIGCVIGPLIGIFAYNLYGAGAFAFTSSMYILFFLTAVFGLRTSAFKSTEKVVLLKFIEKIKILRDPRLFILIICGVLILMTYGTYESFMPVIISSATTLRPSFGLLVSLNAVTVIIFQIFHLRYLSRLSLRISIFAGAVLMFIGFLTFMLPHERYLMSFIAVVLFSLGEGFLFPAYEILMDRISPQNQKALYFGAGELKQIGFFIGPVLGGMIFSVGNGLLIFFACAVWIALAAFGLLKVQVRL